MYGISSCLLFSCTTIACIAATATSAQPREGAIQVAARAISFLQPSLSGPVTTAIVYNPGDDASEAEARAIERSLRSGGRVGAMTLNPRRVSSNALDQLGGAKVAFITHGTNYRRVGSASAARSILSISFDPACTREGHCVMSISSHPKVQIIVSKAATSAARLRFSSSFLMLIKEI